MTTVTAKTCAGCGDEFEVPVLPGKWATIAAAAKLCDRCVDAEEERAEARDRAERRRQALRYSGLPSALQSVSLNGLDRGGNPEAFEAAEAWACGEMPGLLLHGPVGVGKTTLAAAAVLARPRLARWVSVPALIAQSFGGDQARAQAAHDLTSAGPIVLDDIDKVKAGEWVASQLFAAVDARVAAGAQLLVTTNLRLSELGATLGGRFGEAIVSRLAGYCELHEMAGGDRRLA